MWYSNLGKIFISRHILHQHWYTCSIALPVRRNIQHRSLLSRPIPQLRFNLFVISGKFASKMAFYQTKQMEVTLPTLNRKYSFINILCTQSFPQRTHNRTLRIGSIHINHGRHLYYWNQSLNIHMHVCYLDCHEDGLCCYLVILIEKLVRPLQLFYFNLWPIYWLFIILQLGQLSFWAFCII
jgi:hypothetical protein